MKVLLYIILLISYSSNIWATPDLVKEVKEIFTLLKSPQFEKDIKMQQRVTNYFSFSLMSRSILGSDQKKYGVDLKWFSTTLQKIVTKTVYPEAPNFFRGVKISYEDIEKVKGGYTLLTVVTKRGEETEVLLRFAPVAKQWKVVDVSIDDESWVENIREQVHSTLRKKKWPGLKKKLTKRLHDLEHKKGS